MGQLFKDLDPQGPLVQVREGMAVYDSADKKVGTVKAVHMGDGNTVTEGIGTAPATAGELTNRDDTLVGNLGRAIGGGNELPEGARDRLLRVGYIAINAAGIFTGDRYATTEQVATVADDRVILNVPNDELIRG
jgi:hypothetical protein